MCIRGHLGSRRVRVMRKWGGIDAVWWVQGVSQWLGWCGNGYASPPWIPTLPSCWTERSFARMAPTASSSQRVCTASYSSQPHPPDRSTPVRLAIDWRDGSTSGTFGSNPAAQTLGSAQMPALGPMQVVRCGSGKPIKGEATNDWPQIGSRAWGPASSGAERRQRAWEGEADGGVGL